MSDRKHPGAAFWATVVLIAMLLGYPLSFGPACWITSRAVVGSPAVPTVYRPITFAMGRSPGFCRIMTGYAGLGAADGWFWCSTGRDVMRWMHVGKFTPPVN
jgi:hypothetical protein